MSLFLIVLAAGDGIRLKSKTPKAFNKVNNKTLLEYSLDTFKNFPEIKKTVIVYNKKNKQYLSKLKLKNTLKIIGGKTRQQSTFNALKKIKKMNCNKVLIHDSARPNPSIKLIKRIIYSLKKNDAVIPVIKINDATKISKKNIVIGNLNRDNLKLAQTPQGFTFEKLYQKHYENINEAFDDDSALFIKDNEKIFTVNGDKNNLKITDEGDINNFKAIKKGKIYYGLGFDIHKLVKGKKLYLGGINIPFPLGLKGHSDGDPVLHALIDSLLGACRLGDIGKLFSDKNKKYRNIRSTKLLKNVIGLIKSKNFSINNIDINIIAEKPKIKKYAKKISNVISKICKIETNQINIKGKTTEKLGIIGKEKAIASEVITSVTKHD
jgi:2-C-methyl-D-erythritol 4-phosphate cytidylyltransferase/2-C-methyl-D-erythritol 2,4-cyclodiphosphate synthase